MNMKYFDSKAWSTDLEFFLGSDFGPYTVVSNDSALKYA